MSLWDKVKGVFDDEDEKPAPPSQSSAPVVSAQSSANAAERATGASESGPTSNPTLNALTGVGPVPQGAGLSPPASSPASTNSSNAVLQELYSGVPDNTFQQPSSVGGATTAIPPKNGIAPGGDIFGLPDTTGRQVGDVWYTTLDDGRQVRNEIPQGNGLLTVDQTITNRNGTTTFSRVAADVDGSWQRWNNDSDGRASWASKESLTAELTGLNFNPGVSTAGPASTVFGVSANYRQTYTPSYDAAGNMVGYDVGLANGQGLYDNVHFDNFGNRTETTTGLDSAGNITSTFSGQIDSYGYGWRILGGAEWSVFPDSQGKQHMYRTEQAEDGLHVYNIYPDGRRTDEFRGNNPGEWYRDTIVEGKLIRTDRHGENWQMMPREGGGSIAVQQSTGASFTYDATGKLVDYSVAPGTFDTMGAIDKGLDWISPVGLAFGMTPGITKGGANALVGAGIGALSLLGAFEDPDKGAVRPDWGHTLNLPDRETSFNGIANLVLETGRDGKAALLAEPGDNSAKLALLNDLSQLTIGTDWSKFSEHPEETLGSAMVGVGLLIAPGVPKIGKTAPGTGLGHTVLGVEPALPRQSGLGAELSQTMPEVPSNAHLWGETAPPEALVNAPFMDNGPFLDGNGLPGRIVHEGGDRVAGVPLGAPRESGAGTRPTPARPADNRPGTPRAALDDPPAPELVDAGRTTGPTPRSNAGTGDGPGTGGGARSGGGGSNLTGGRGAGEVPEGLGTPDAGTPGIGDRAATSPDPGKAGTYGVGSDGRWFGYDREGVRHLLPEGVAPLIDRLGRLSWRDIEAGTTASKQPWAKTNTADNPAVLGEQTAMSPYDGTIRGQLDEVNALQNASKAARDALAAEIKSRISGMQIPDKGKLRDVTVNDFSKNNIDDTIRQLRAVRNSDGLPKHDLENLDALEQLGPQLSSEIGTVARLAERRGEIGGDLYEQVENMETVYRGSDQYNPDRLSVRINSDGTRTPVLMELKGGESVSLGIRSVGGRNAQQGSTLYGRDEFLRKNSVDGGESDVLQALRAYDERNGTTLADDLLAGRIDFEYVLVATEPNTNVVTVTKFDPKPGEQLNLKNPGDHPNSAVSTPFHGEQPTAPTVPQVSPTLGTGLGAAMWAGLAASAALWSNEIGAMTQPVGPPAPAASLPNPFLGHTSRRTNQTLTINIAIDPADRPLAFAA